MGLFGFGKKVKKANKNLEQLNAKMEEYRTFIECELGIDKALIECLKDALMMTRDLSHN